ncbi:aminotransferase class III-fold pyridoxal phosphate-dependent enzyme [Deinococcus sp. QL22]|uniref:aminotransferase class III-fold pyridoxal phosphate-dependent enzyme n=1 Tax=Deinococcus sp. QL22 TaxID=2939437 RepID=UPI00201815C6|nr:aminotransferase class III-fold pyridoxal phosphate-dependent enzyme [Deinococcus sp. QL22]UQN09208.1 aminotransferase class III-fold pyridoxal phosphate-dependent enzyme [Deinococcus sp. QL22]
MTAAPLALDAEQKRALNLLAAGNRDVLGVLAGVATRQRRSLEWHARAQQALSGGRSQLPYFSPVLPLCLAEAQAGRFVCTDGHEFVDAHMGYTAGILGHNPPAVVTALAAALGKGPGAGYFVAQQVELAETICALVPGMERVAFLHAGADAVTAAVRLCRAATRRTLIAKFEGCYHGWHESGLVNPALTWAGRTPEGPLESIAPEVATGGVSRAAGAEFLILPYGDPVALQLIRDHAAQLAGVLLDPVPRFMMNDLAGAQAFAQQLRSVTAELGIPLICDEVVTGFRLAPGGVAEAFGVQPDLSCFGKITGGLGLPLSVVGGRADLMNRATTAGLVNDYVSQKVWISTTAAANSLSVTASLAALRATAQAGAGLFAPLDAHHAHLKTQVDALAAQSGLPLRLDGHPRLYSMLAFALPSPDAEFTPFPDAHNPARAYFRAFTPANVRAARLLTLYLRLMDVYMETLPTVDLSAAHTAADVAQLSAGLTEAVGRMQAHGVFA